MAECAVCTGGYAVDFQQQPALWILCSVKVETERCMCMCIYPWNWGAHTALWIPGCVCWTQRKKRKIYFSFQEDVTGQKQWYPFKVCRAHIYPQIHNFAGWFRSFSLTCHVWRGIVGPRLASCSQGGGWSSGGAAPARSRLPHCGTRHGLLWPAARHGAMAGCWAMVMHEFLWFRALQQYCLF